MAKKGYDDFFKLSKTDQRRVVAEDVLLQLLRGKYEASPGTYVMPLGGDYLHNYQRGSSLFELATSRQRCAVCAIGAAALSAIACSGNMIEGERDDAKDVVSKLFPPTVAGPMEAAFEGFAMDGRGYCPVQEEFHAQFQFNYTRGEYIGADFFYRDSPQWRSADGFEALASIFYTIWKTGTFTKHEEFVPDALDKFVEESGLKEEWKELLDV